MKNLLRNITISAFAFLFVVGIASAYEVQSGDTLSKISQRFGTTWQQLYQANPQIEDPDLIYTGQELFIDGVNEPVLGAFRPSGISVSIRQDLVSGASRTGNTLDVDPLVTLDGRRLVMSDIGDIAFGKIGQGTSNEEIISWTGMIDNTTYYRLTGVEWGYNFYNNATSTDNFKRHNAGASFIITNDDHFIAEQYAALDEQNTFNANQIVASTTANKLKWCFSDCSDFYLWHDTTLGTIGYASSSSEFTFSDAGTTFTAINPITLVSGELKLATTTNHFDLSGGLLALRLNNSLTSDASGLAVDGTADFNFTGDVQTASTTLSGNTLITGNATSTGSFNFDVNPLVSGVPFGIGGVSSTTVATTTASGAGATTIYTKSIDGNTLGTDGYFTVKFTTETIDTGTTDSSIVVNYSGQSVCDFQNYNNSSPGATIFGRSYFECTVIANNATNAQGSMGWYNSAGGFAAGTFVNGGGVSTSTTQTVDSTTAQNLTIVATNADAGDSISLLRVIVEFFNQ